MTKCPICQQVTEINSKNSDQWLELFKKNRFIIKLSKELFPKKDCSLYLCKNYDLIFVHLMKIPGHKYYEQDCLYYRIGRILDL